MKRYLKEVYFEGCPEEAIDDLVDLLYAEDIIKEAEALRTKYERSKWYDEKAYGNDIYEGGQP